MPISKSSIKSRYDFAIQRASTFKRDTCLIWPFAKNQHGYGLVHIPNTERCTLVHRVVYSVLIEPIPEGMNVCHHCRGPCW